MLLILLVLAINVHKCLTEMIINLLHGRAYGGKFYEPAFFAYAFVSRFNTTLMTSSENYGHRLKCFACE